MFLALRRGGVVTSRKRPRLPTKWRKSRSPGLVAWLSDGGGGAGRSDREKILSSFSSSQDSPANRRMTLDAKLRMLRVMDTIYDSDKDKDMYDKLTSYVRFGSNQSVGFDEFLLADYNGDGRVSSAEWEHFLQEKAAAESGLNYQPPNALNVEVPLSTNQLHTMAESNEGLHISINGMRYRLSLTPEGKTSEIIGTKSKVLHETLQQLGLMETEKRPLDAKAARHTKRVLTFALFYLLSQATVIAKLTFFSRFGWDVMEPITYFITFGTAVMGFVFFQYHKIEYSYPALAALLTQRKARKLYQSYDFDIEKYMQLQAKALQIEQQLLVLRPPRSMLSAEEAQTLQDDLRQVQEIRNLQQNNSQAPTTTPDPNRLKREPSFTSIDSY